jgi:3-deoxy-D-manno-octulosonate 8-phosphate phosphatase (KDO 8-P phosphatase)
MKPTKAELIRKAKGVKILLLDVDGILTDGIVHILPDGEEFYSFNVYDGYGIKLWQRAGFRCAFVTGRGARAVLERAKKLGVHHVYQNSGDKLAICEEIAAKEGISLAEMAFVGDDIQDLPALRNAGLAISVPNGRPEAHASAHMITKTRGGQGAVREVVEFLLHAKGLWKSIPTAQRIES